MPLPTKKPATSRPRRKRPFAVPLLFGVSLLVGLLIAEFAVRLLFDDEINTKTLGSGQDQLWVVDLTQTSEHPDLIYEIRPSVDLDDLDYRVVTSSDAIRIAPDATPTANPDIKIALLGDSSSFGWWVNYEATYGELLRRKLGERTGQSIELRNFSVPGYNSHHNRVTLRDRVLPWGPDLIVVHYDHNDADPINYRPPGIMPPEYGDNILNCALYKFVVRRLRRRRELSFTTAPSDDPENPEQFYQSYRYAGPQFDRHMEEMKQMAELARDRQISIVAVLFNTWLISTKDPQQDAFYTLLHEPVSRRLREMDFEVIDTYAPYQELMSQKGWRDLSELWLDKEDAHPNRDGHRFLADVIFTELAKRKQPTKLFSPAEATPAG
jgi:lysophospholipase L1-like esterase